MSYVLEALKKAQTQREQGAMPGIHSVQVPQGALNLPSRAPRYAVWWVGGGVLVAGVAVLLWWLAKPDVPLAPPVAVRVAPAPTLPSTPIEASSAVATPAAVPGAEPVAPVAAALAAARAVVPKAAPEVASIGTMRVYAASELPERIRIDLPVLSITGGSYSTNPAQRLIIVNSQVFTEKSQPAPGVVIERIEQAAVVLSFRGYAYRVRF